VEWFVDKLEEATDVQRELFFTVHTSRNFCQKCLCLLYKLDKNFYYKWKAQYTRGAVYIYFIRYLIKFIDILNTL